MAIAMVAEIPGGTAEMYDRVMELLDMDSNPQEGAILHVAGPMPGGWRVLDIWESEEAFQRFASERLMQAAQEAGVPPFEPQLAPVHNVYAPALGLLPDVQRSLPA